MPALARVGSGSFRATLLASPAPSFFTVIVKPTGLPATTVCASGVFVTTRCGLPTTQTPSRSVALVLPDVTVAVLSRLMVWFLTWTWQSGSLAAPGAGAVVGLVTWTEAEPPAARVPKLQDRAVPA